MFLSELTDKITRFFTVFLSFPILFQLISASLDAVLCAGHLHLKKKAIANKTVHFLIMVISMLLLCLISNSFTDALNMGFVPFLIVFSIIIPGSVHILISGKGSLENKIIKTLLYISSAYVVTEINHQVNLLTMSLDSAALSNFLRSLPSLLMLLTGFLVGFYNINRYPNTSKANLLLSILVFISLFAISLLGSTMQTEKVFPRIFLILVNITFLLIDIGIYIGGYYTSKKQEMLLEYQAQAKLNDAAYQTLKLNEESIERASIVRHDLKNHYAYIAGLLSQKKYDDALKYVSDINEDSFGEFHIVDCGNHVISSIMNLELTKARLKNIELKYLLAVPKKLPFKETDLCSLLTNLIDNAMEAIERDHLEGLVDVKMFVKESYFRILVTNPTTLKEVSLKTVKKDSGHGYGMKIIQGIVKANNGFLHMEIKNGEFLSDVMLDMDNKGESNADDWND